jgi:hypothetical protein
VYRSGAYKTMTIRSDQKDDPALYAMRSLWLRAWIASPPYQMSRQGLERHSWSISSLLCAAGRGSHEEFLALALGMMDDNLARLTLFWSILRDTALDINYPSGHIAVLASQDRVGEHRRYSNNACFV